MNSLTTITMIAVITLIIGFTVPIKSLPLHEKRWTFNTWRLHGHRHAPHASINPTTGLIYFA